MEKKSQRSIYFVASSKISPIYPPFIFDRKWLDKTFVFILLLTCCFSCTDNLPVPSNKQGYLDEFERFSHTVNKGCNSYSDSEVFELDAYFQTLSRTWYNHFYNELTSDEVLEVYAYRTQYLTCKIERELNKTGKELYERIENNLLNSNG